MTRSQQKPRIWVSTPYDFTGQRDLGQAYNLAMEAVPDTDWACMCDYDVMFLSPHFYQVLQSYAQLAAVQNYGLLVPLTNRIGNPHQRYPLPDPDMHDIVQHRRIAADVLASGEGSIYITDVTRAMPRISGLVMLVSKAAWKRAGGFAHGFFVDNDFHFRIKQAGMGVGIMRQLYVYHFYRGDGDLSHLPTRSDGRPMLNREWARAGRGAQP